jgi:hypothetical protein
LKQSIKPIGDLGPLTLVSWGWNALGESLGCRGKSVGFIAQDVKKHFPECVTERDGYLAIYYDALWGKLCR